MAQEVNENDTTPSANHEQLPLAPAQHQVWLDQQAYPDSCHLNIGGTSTVVGELDISLLNLSLKTLCNRAQALRILPTPDGKLQLIEQWPDDLIDYKDLTVENCASTQALEDLIKAMTTDEMKKPFVIDGKTRPWRVYVWKSDEQKHTLWIRFYHLVMDGFGTAEFFKQWSAIHCAMAQDKPLPEDNSLSYQHYLDDALAYLDSDTYQQNREFWHNTLPELPPAILEKRRRQHQAHKSTSLAPGHHHYDLIPLEQYQLLENFAKAQKVTTFHLFIAALAIYFCRTYHKQEIVLGVLVLNRRGKRYKQTLGMFSSVMPLRVKISKKHTVQQLLSTISSDLRSLYRHARYPLYHLVRERNLLKSGRDNMFDVFLSFEPHSYNVYFDQAHLTSPRQLFSSTARYPLMVNVCQFHEQSPVELVLEASSAYLSEKQTAKMAGRLHHLLLALTVNAEQNLDTLPLITQAEFRDLTITRHDNIPTHQNPQTFISKFEHLSVLHPRNTALIFTDNDKVHQSNYQTVNSQANRLAYILQKQNIQQGEIIPLVAHRCPQTIIAYLAIAKLGAVILPLDLQTPIKRIKKIVKQCQSKIVLTNNNTLTDALSSQVININASNSPLTDESLPDSNLKVNVSGSNLAIILYTSGSTGEPKGVMISHSALTRRLAWLTRNFGITEQDVMLQTIQLTFDPSLAEILLPLTQGASLALPPAGKIAPLDIAYFAEKYQATMLFTVPTILRYISQSIGEPPNLALKTIGCGGEVLPPELAQTFSDKTNCTLFNLWGPTETCIFASAYRVDPHSTFNKQPVPIGPIPIGKAVDDTQIFILDENLQLLPEGATGEIYVGGNALAQGYLNAPQLSAAKFIENPFKPGTSIYRTGDLGYWDENNQLQFVCRKDRMLKVNGQRVEPSQIESLLNQHAQIAAVAVKLAGKQLHGWLELQSPIKQSQQLLLEHSLKNALHQQLPAYMVPAGFTILDKLPQQNGGKIDYQALKPDPINSHTQTTKHQSLEPTTTLEKLLLALWQKALSNEKIDITSDFFASGGTSVEALNLLTDIRNQLNQQLPLATLMQNPSVKQLANIIIKEHQPLMVNLSGHHKGITLYLAASGYGDAMRLKPLAKALGKQFHLIMLQPPKTEQYQSIKQLAQYYATAISHTCLDTKSSQPPMLAGFSIGGLSALETARTLTAQNHQIGGLVLIDSTYPGWLIRRTAIWSINAWLMRKIGLEELTINQRTIGSLINDQGLNGQINALKSYQAKPFAHPVTLVISKGLKRWYSRLVHPWRKLFGEHLNEQHLPGFHASLFNHEHVDKLAEVIKNSYEPNP